MANLRASIRLARGLVACALGAVALCANAGEASAGQCHSATQTSCWAEPSNNYCQLAVGATGMGNGIACAVLCRTDSDWGGEVECFAAGADPGSMYISARTGHSPYLDGQNSTRRIVALSVGPDKNNLNNIILHLLRSDGSLLHSVKQFPVPSGANPVFPLLFDTGSIPSGHARSLSGGPTNSSGGSNFLVDTDLNNTYTWAGFGWTRVNSDGRSVLVGGGEEPGAETLTLYGTDGFSRSVVSDSGSQLATLPFTLAGATSDPNTSFTTAPMGLMGGWVYQGRQTPLSAGGYTNKQTAWAVGQGHCNGGPCIYRSTADFGQWSTAWTLLSVGGFNDTSDPGYPMPTTIQDAYWMHRRLGEVWVIAGYNHLRAWIP